MSLIKSISGIRGTIGERVGEDLTSMDVINFSAAYGQLIINKYANNSIKIVVGRDARISGERIKNLVINTLVGMGVNVIDVDLAATPSVEMAVIRDKAQGGIIVTASHNPQEWNALKFLNEQGEFMSAEEGKQLVSLSENIKFNYSDKNKSELIVIDTSLADYHIKEILKLDLVSRDSITKASFKIVIDGINSVGGVVIPQLLTELGVKEIIKVNCEPNGLFAHQPEPLAKNLEQIMDKVKAEKADLGIVVDPDVDRLAFIDENGEMFGEEYTLVAVADYVLQNFNELNNKQVGKYYKATVSNLSSSRALEDITEKYDGNYRASAVGEFNVVELMKKIKAIIGGEGSGGIIYPELHYGRDALVGVALFLSALAQSQQKMSDFRKKFPTYFMIKDKIELITNSDLSVIFKKLRDYYQEEKIIDTDGLKISWPQAWVHLRVSNTEPIIRLYAEAPTQAEAEKKVKEIKEIILANIQ